MIVRDSGLLGSGCDMRVYIDGALAARLGAGESVGLAVPPGNVVVGIAPTGAALCSGGMSAVRATEATVVAGKVKSRLHTFVGGGMQVLHISYIREGSMIALPTPCSVAAGGRKKALN